MAMECNLIYLKKMKITEKLRNEDMLIVQKATNCIDNGMKLGNPNEGNY